jgi:tetratricopeptide (TPR) repeat protein
MPAQVDAERYFTALAELEETGHFREARAAWQSAVARWPDSPVAQFGLANSEFRLEDWPRAEAHYRQLLQRHPALAAARNNLALSLLRQGRVAEARDEARAALEQAGDDPGLGGEIRETLAEIDAGAH